MSAAYKCNRCGTFFAVPSDPNHRKNLEFLEERVPIEPEEPPVQIKCKPLRYVDSPQVTSVPFDLCARCAVLFREFLYGGAS